MATSIDMIAQQYVREDAPRYDVQLLDQAVTALDADLQRHFDDLAEMPLTISLISKQPRRADYSGTATASMRICQIYNRLFQVIIEGDLHGSLSGRGVAGDPRWSPSFAVAALRAFR